MKEFSKLATLAEDGTKMRANNRSDVDGVIRKMEDALDDLQSIADGSTLRAMLKRGGFPATESKSLIDAVNKVEREIADLHQALSMSLDEAKKPKTDKQALTDKEDPSVTKGKKKLGDKAALGAPAAKKVSVPVKKAVNEAADPYDMEDMIDSISKLAPKGWKVGSGDFDGKEAVIYLDKGNATDDVRIKTSGDFDKDYKKFSAEFDKRDKEASAPKKKVDVSSIKVSKGATYTYSGTRAANKGWKVKVLSITGSKVKYEVDKAGRVDGPYDQGMDQFKEYLVTSGYKS